MNSTPQHHRVVTVKIADLAHRQNIDGQACTFKHLGQPMAGVYDASGVIASIVLIVGGLAIGAWGLQRRDLGR